MAVACLLLPRIPNHREQHCPGTITTIMYPTRPFEPAPVTMQEPHATGGRGIPTLDTPKRLVVAVTHDEPPGPILELLNQAGLHLGDGEGTNSQPTPHPQLLDGHALGPLDQLPVWLQDHPDDHLLLLFSVPVVHVASAMAKGQLPGKALEHWAEGADRALAVARRNRRRTTMLPLEAALADPAALFELLEHRFGLTLNAAPEALSPLEAPGAIFRLMAENAVWQSSRTRNLAAELQASALPMTATEDLAQPAIDQVYAEYRKYVDAAPAAKAETDRLNNDLKAAKEKLVQLEQQLAEPKIDHPKIQDLQDENDLLLQQLHHVQEELERYYLENQTLQSKESEFRKEFRALEKSTQKLQRHNDGLQRKVNYMVNSKSWKLTRPLRAVIKRLKGKD